MFKKIVLVLASFGLACVAFLAYMWQDTAPPSARKMKEAPLQQQVHRPTTQPTTQSMTLKDVSIPAGEAPVMRIIDPQTGETTMMFQALRWKPISETTFHAEQPTARVLLPGGQLAYIRADRGEITIQRDERNNFNPKRGKMIGHVQIFIDRTKPDWRKENPSLAEPDQHPEGVVKIWMDDVAFDLDLARLQTDGPITLQSVDGTIEGRGLTLIWNEVNRRVKFLQIKEGKRAFIRVKSLVELGIAKADQDDSAAQASSEESSPQAEKSSKQAKSTKSRKRKAATAPAQLAEKRGSTISLTNLSDKEELQADRVDTYKIVFKDQIVAEQRQGLRVVGRLKADTLEMLRDFGSHERAAVEHTPGSKTSDDESEDDQPNKASAQTAPAGTPLAKKDSTLELKWKGELVVTPEQYGSTQPAGTAERFHVMATGNPVEIHDRQLGEVACRRLEYHDETQKIWLDGTSDKLVVLQADPRRQVAGERVFLDRKSGLARVDGPGRMVDLRPGKAEDKWPPCMRDELKKAARANTSYARRSGKPDSDEVVVNWKKGVEIRFGLMKVERSDPAGSPSVAQSKEYLKSAHFEGDVSYAQPGQSMSADLIDIVFSEPIPDKSAEAKPNSANANGQLFGQDSSSVAAKSLRAQGNVRLVNDDSTITCDRGLDVEMGTNDVGDNVPQMGKAHGHVIAEQGGQMIESFDGMTVTLASVPKVLSQTERERYEAAAKKCGYTPESTEWKQVEAYLQSRRTTVLRTLVARKNIQVTNPDQEVDVAADTIDCTFDDNRQISRAQIVGNAETPAHVSMSDFYVRGKRIDFNVATQSASVPGEGILRFYTKQDLTGKQVNEPVPIVVTWKDSMSFDGQSNVGLFNGSVRAVSQNTVLDSRELHLRFDNMPKEPTASQTVRTDDSRWIAGRLFDMLRDRGGQEQQASAASFSRGFRKRLIHLQPVGDAVISSSEYEKPKPQFGPFSAMMTDIMPDVFKTPQSQPSQEDMRLLSLIRINGPRIAIDLINEHMVVEGTGNLLVLDYRMPKEQSAPRRTSVTSGGLAASLQSSGPSQTVFTWQNSMSYLNRRNVAVMDKDVVMRHVAGSELAMPEEVAAAMKVDPRKITSSRGRRDELTCANLVAEFTRNKNRSNTEGASLTSATELRALQASGRVRMQENNRTVEGDLITYDNSTGLVLVQGSAMMPAYGAELDEKTGGLRASVRGNRLEWNLKTGVITSDSASGTIIGK